MVFSFIIGRKLEYSERTNDLPKVTDKLYHKMLNQVHLTMGTNKTHKFSSDTLDCLDVNLTIVCSRYPHLPPSNFKIQIKTNHVVHMLISPSMYCHPPSSPNIALSKGCTVPYDYHSPDGSCLIRASE